jgi:hypothetical protein
VSVLKKFRKKAQAEEFKSWLPEPKKKHTLRSERRSWEREGAWRVDNQGEYWWFEGDQLDDLDQINLKIEDDTEFWKAFHEYIEANDVRKTRSAATKTNWEKWDWKDDIKGSGNSLSSYWNPWSKSSAKWAGDIDTRVAIAMRAVQSTVRVIDDSGKRMTVAPSTTYDKTVAFTDFDNSRIVISAKPIADKKLNEGQAIDVMTGYGLHEASHSKYTRQVINSIDNLTPKGTAGFLSNIAEDVRIERLTGEEFPGFAPYFDKANDYVWPEVKPPKEYGPDLTSKCNAAVAICKWPDKTKPIAKEYPEEFEWWSNWINEYKPDGSNLREQVEKALAHLRNAEEDEESKPDPKSESGSGGKAAEQMDEEEKREATVRQDLDAAISDFMERNGVRKFCSHDIPDADQLDALGGSVEQVDRLIREELTKDKVEIKTPNGAMEAPVYASKPEEDANSKAAFNPKSDPVLALYKAALVFRPVDPHWSVKLQREGEMDDDELWRWAADDWRIFEERQIPKDAKARVGLLVDISGSMYGGKLEAAIKMARLFVEALNSIHGVTPYVWAHTGDVHEDGSFVYRIYEPGDPITRLGLLDTLEHANNYDGHAIAWVCERIQEASLPDEQKLLIVLSDGLPSGGMGYGGHEGQQHVRIAVDDAQKAKNIRVLQIAIDMSVDEARQSRMFDEFIPFKPGDSLDSVPKRLTRWLEKAI